MALTRTQKLGIVLTLSSLLVGMAGTVLSIYQSFGAFELAENAGMGPIGDSLRNALIFTAVGLAGPIVGGLMLIFGRSKS